MKYLALLFIWLTLPLLAQDKPQVTVSQMTDAEYKKLDDAAVLMQKKAEEYRKAADDYDTAKSDILGKYNATNDVHDCNGNRKIVDVRGQYIIVEIDYGHTGGLFGGNCPTLTITPAISFLAGQK